MRVRLRRSAWSRAGRRHGPILTGQPSSASSAAVRRSERTGLISEGPLMLARLDTVTGATLRTLAPQNQSASAVGRQGLHTGGRPRGTGPGADRQRRHPRRQVVPRRRARPPERPTPGIVAIFDQHLDARRVRHCVIGCAQSLAALMRTYSGRSSTSTLGVGDARSFRERLRRHGRSCDRRWHRHGARARAPAHRRGLPCGDL